MDAKRTAEAIKVRRKIVGVFSRSQLERLSGMASPWLADTATLKQTIMTRWPQAEIQNEFTALMNKA